MNNLSASERETLKYFIFVVIRRLHEEREFLGNPNLRFVFDDKVINMLENYVSESKKGKFYYIKTLSGQDEYLMIDDVIKSLNILKDNQKEYRKYLNNGNEIDLNNMFLKIDDINKFTKLLHQIVASAYAKFEKNYEYNLLYSMWIRMTPNEFNDINAFLLRQLNFILNDNILIGYGNYFKEYNDCNLLYDIETNNSWYETNRNIHFYLKKDHEFYNFPMIHYAFARENERIVCYIYGIQDSLVINNSKIIEDDLVTTKRNLRNKYVRYTFIMSLYFFIELLKEKGIDNIKVPLLEVLNYPYHENLSEITKVSFENMYSKEKIDYLEKIIGYKVVNDETIKYLHEKQIYHNFVDKQDVISKNKTERLVETFLSLNDKYSILDFLNDPMIEDDNLNMKIKAIK